ncbi:TonB-dependent receptor [Massilia aurea]|uniref:TonB-dependent receptor plug domain-containing protein n=1 Tax=Massilia aurea TaxID=373040 RepID=UPI0034618AFF
MNKLLAVLALACVASQAGAARMRWALTCFAVCLPALARAEPPIAAPPHQVVVNGSQTDLEAGQDFVAGKIIVGKARIAASGLQNTGELLAREPAVTVGKDGRIGLLGLPGYTQILVDGMPYQGNPMEIDLTQVDGMEIIKTTTAATGPFGIAGTINIIRRKAVRKATSQLRTSLVSRDGRLGGDAAWSTGGQVADSRFSYLVNLSARHTRSSSRSDYTQTVGERLVRDFDGALSRLDQPRMLSASGEVSWKFQPDHTLVVSPNLSWLDNSGSSRERRFWQDNTTLFADQNGNAPTRYYYLPLRWNWQIDADSSLAVELKTTGGRGDERTTRLENWSDSGVLRRDYRRDVDTKNDFLDLTIDTKRKKGHAITAGAKLARNESDTLYDDRIDGQPDYSLSVLGPRSASRTKSARLFVQDEWRINRIWALNLGTSVERRNFRLYEGAASNRSGFTMWSPSAHVSQRIGGNRKRQLRMSLARSFRPPFEDELQLRPTINTFAPCPNWQLCGANTVDTADYSGNPFLQPERALGLNLSYAHGFGRDSEVQLEFYARDISNKTGTEVALADVPWAATPRYVIRQANLGQAKVRGLSLEARLAGKDLAARFASLELSGSIGVADSTLNDLPGPDNQIADQSPWSVKIGGSYALKAWPVTLGVDASYLPDDWVRHSVNQRVFESSKRTLNLNASWTISKTTTLRFNLDNLLPQDKTRIDDYLEGAGLVRRATRSSNDPRFIIRFNTQL